MGGGSWKEKERGFQRNGMRRKFTFFKRERERARERGGGEKSVGRERERERERERGGGREGGRECV